MAVKLGTVYVKCIIVCACIVMYAVFHAGSLMLGLTYGFCQLDLLCASDVRLMAEMTALVRFFR